MDHQSPTSYTGKSRLLLVDDHPVLRHGVSRLLDDEPDFQVCGEADGAPTALTQLRTQSPDLVLMDIALNGMNGLELIKMMLSEQPKLKILVLSMHDESLYALRALRAGARGYMMKGEPLDNLLAAIRRVLKGDIYVSPRFSERLVFKAIHGLDGGLGSPVDNLSDRELEVLQFLGRGLGTRAIAGELHLSIKTIETHRAHLKEKLGLADAGELVRFALEWVARENG